MSGLYFLEQLSEWPSFFGVDLLSEFDSIGNNKKYISMFKTGSATRVVATQLELNRNFRAPLKLL